MTEPMHATGTPARPTAPLHMHTLLVNDVALVHQAGPPVRIPVELDSSRWRGNHSIELSLNILEQNSPYNNKTIRKAHS